MKKTLVILALVFVGTLCAMTTEVGSIRGFVHGVEPNCSYDNWVSHVVEAAPAFTNHYAPWDVQTTGFGSYREPTETVRLQWSELIQAWLAQDVNLADSLIVQYGLPYELVHFQDTDAGREYYMLRELLNDDIDYNGAGPSAIVEEGSFDYGWGLYIYNPAASRPMMITVVHPCDGYPAPVIALEAMLKWDARFLFVAGAGREVLNPGSDNNSSLSDPSRNPNHVFNIAYQLACLQIRGLTGRTEFSVQLDTFDWQRHTEFCPVMVSAGNGRVIPTLPIRDLSHLKKDFIHHTPWEVLPANAVGQHSAVTVIYYYAVYAEYNLAYDAFGHSGSIPYSDALPGYVNNQQMLFTEQPNAFDGYSPFLHVSLGELPRFLYQNEGQWRKFYGWDEALQRWNLAQRWSKFLQCYTPWLDALDEVLDDLLRMDDFTAPSTPGDFHAPDVTSNYFSLAWDRSYDYDFDSYEVVINYESEGEEIEVIIDRETIPRLAWQLERSVSSLRFSDYSSPMTVRVRARDKNGRYSSDDGEILLYQPNSSQGSFQAMSCISGVDSIELRFRAQCQNEVNYQLKRSVNGSEYEPLVTLPIDTYGYYSYNDTDVSYPNVYRYRAGVIMADSTEYWHHQRGSAQPLKPIGIYLNNEQNTLVDSLQIGQNYFAKDEVDRLDIIKAEVAQGRPYVWLASKYENQFYGVVRRLHRDFRAPYDQLEQCKQWDLEVRASDGVSELVISSDIGQTGLEGYLLLKDPIAGRWHDLRQSAYHFNMGDAIIRNLRLYWGFLEPEIHFNDLPRQLVEAGSELELNWQVINPAHIQQLELWMYSRSDSLLFDDSVSPWEESYIWQTPETALCGYLLMLKGVDNDGRPLRFLSNNLYDIVPETLEVDIPVGLSALCFYVIGWSGSVSSVMAPGTQVWKMLPDQGWALTNNLRSFEAYIVDSPAALTLSHVGSTLTQSQGRRMLQGWNFIHNPHFHRYDLSQIRFGMNGKSYSYAELAEMQLVSQKPYTLTARGWEHVDEIQPNTAFLIYYYGSTPIVMTLDPGIIPAELLPPSKPWELSLSFYSGEKGRDSIEIGSDARGSDNEVTAIDGPKPESIATQELRAYILGSDDQHLQSKYKSLYEEEVESSKIWDFEVVKTQSLPLTIEADFSRLPGDYRVQLVLLGQVYTLNPEQPLQIKLPDGTFSGHIVVTRNLVHNLDECRQLGIKLYPNPFRETITVSWDNVKSAKRPKATVYNIKGQKVRSLDIQESSSQLTATWDGRDQKQRTTASGLYLIRIESAGRMMTKKVIKY
ncbi:MAG TPA: T9SS type A sorting domain-containing protein [Candidatus Cloacimonadota bacterium]|nr:T9SS type A sorting domain-containing protein [Candidatus Cloacimonadota bacterium]